MRWQARLIEICVGLFLLGAIAAFTVLAFKASGLTHLGEDAGYVVKAEFDNVGDLKVRAPVTMAGVRIGKIVAIHLDPRSFQANVMLRIHSEQNRIPADSSAKILTEGLLGSNYISITPGFARKGEEEYLKEGSQIQETYPAIILENMIEQFMFNLNKDKK